MNSRRRTAAGFIPARRLTVSIKGQGSTEPRPGTLTLDRGARVHVSALPAPGWKLDRWSGDLSGSAPARVITMNSDKSITACFAGTDRKLTIIMSGKGVTNPSPGTNIYARGAHVKITAKPAPGWRFDRWSGDLSGTASTCVVTLNSDKSISAIFLPTRKLTISVKGEGSTEPHSGTLTLDQGARVHISALPAPGWRFDQWSGDLSGSASTRVITMNSDKRITACFTVPYRFDKKVETPPSYIANHRSREIHKHDCRWVIRMSETNKIPCNNLSDVAELIRNEEYNGCHYCLPRYDRDTLSSEIVLKNLEADLANG